MTTKKIIGLLASLVLVSLLVPAPANAVWREGCGANTQFRVDWWTRTQTTSVLTYDPMDALWRSAKMRHRVGMGYWLCKRGNRPDKVRFEKLYWQSTKKDNHELPHVRGIKMNPYISNHAGNSTNPGEHYMKYRLFAGNSGDSHGTTYDFTNSGWMLRRSHPFWTISAWVDIQAQPGDHLDFKAPAGRHYLGYENDQLLVK